MPAWAQFLIATGGAAGLVGWLVRYIVTSQRDGYRDRVADIKQHNADVVAILREQLATGAVNAESLTKLVDTSEATKRLVEAWPAAWSRERA
jgi:hypothetical protein